MSIYDDVMAAQQLIDECCDLTTGEILDEATFDQASALKEEILALGLETLCKVRANRQAEVDMLKAEEKRLADKRKRLEGQVSNLEEWIYKVYQQGDNPVQKAGTFTLSTRKSTQVVVDDDFNNEKFQTIKEVKTIDKIALKEALKNGETIAGAKLFTKYNLQIK